MLDNRQLLAKRDPSGALAVAATEYQQTAYQPQIVSGVNDGRDIQTVVVAAMGGSALAALLLKTWLADKLTVPFEVVRDYQLPRYVDQHSLVIASSYSGNTEETVGDLQQAIDRQAQLAVITSAGKLLDSAQTNDITHIVLPSKLQPRMAMIYNLRALAGLLHYFGLIKAAAIDEIATTSDWLKTETAAWLPTVSTAENYAKQLALQAVGKTPVFYGGSLTAELAYKWKISWNENAKNVAFWNQYPEASHNEFTGWTSHPIEKPFAIFDLISSRENPQILKRFSVSDRLLSGRRPKATAIRLAGDSLLQQLLWGCILSDFVSIYVAILNNVDPTALALVDTLKHDVA